MTLGVPLPPKRQQKRRKRCDIPAASSESARRLTMIDAPENRTPIARKPRNRRRSGPARPTENQPSENHIYLVYMKFEHVYFSKVAQAQQIRCQRQSNRMPDTEKLDSVLNPR